MKRGVYVSVFLAVVSSLAALLSWASELHFWWAFLLVAGAIFANGLLATLEDDLPGGFNNPDGTHTPKYVRGVAFAVRLLAGICLLLICLAMGLFFWG